ncbi:hypothetical protein TDB9533_01061 [Thalassocella blandensis]|nr:hypothetical protein TDB9533_01061 [Thalassocella blandensis]
MLPLLQKLKKTDKTVREKLLEEEPLQPVMPQAPELSEDDLKKSIAMKLRNYQPVDKEANFTGPRYSR